MKIYFLRHAKAEKDTEGGDSRRRLTARGRADALSKAEKFRKKWDAPDAIITSPYPRAEETAEIFATVLHLKETLVRDDAFVAGARTPDVLRKLRDYAEHKRVLLVGHEPWMSETVSLLISGSTQSRIHLKKCALAVLDVDTLGPGGGTLEALY